MHSTNADDFPNVVALAEKYDVASLTILGVKPDSRHMLPTIPSAEQMKAVSKFVRTYRGKVQLIIESCFSPMRALTYQTALLGNLNIGIAKGCLAGKGRISVNVDGLFSPCRHLEYYESFPTLEEYWEKSEVLKRLRTMDQEDAAEPCESCRYKDHCRPCAAINSKLENRLYRGNKYCPVAEK